MKRSKFILAGLVSCLSACFSKQDQSRMVDKMPVDLETQFALSALPPRLRESATVYLLDPEKGYYVGRTGTNGFSAFVNRTQWEWAEFRQDTYEAVSYDSAGSKAYLPPFFDVAAMRASGEFTPGQIRDSIIQRVKDGRYKPASRVGVSYMLAPLLRNHVGNEMQNQVMPHYMFYAPYLSDEDIGGGWVPGGYQPFAVNSGPVLDKAHSIFNYIIIAAGETEKAKIVADNEDLLKKLGEYKAFLKVDPAVVKNQHQH
ncbi:MAG: hypothetical protein C5B59_03395 [Bacteroidetes bacterium]|nr:MAG: hypothetical protein C5B59_03395 [Bacteroidota bacterium]